MKSFKRSLMRSKVAASRRSGAFHEPMTPISRPGAKSETSGNPNSPAVWAGELAACLTGDYPDEAVRSVLRQAAAAGVDPEDVHRIVESLGPPPGGRELPPYSQVAPESPRPPLRSTFLKSEP